MYSNEIAIQPMDTRKSFRMMGFIGATLGLAVIIASTLAYLPTHPHFSMFTTYLSDIGDTPGWPQVLFNSGTLVAAPVRYLILVLFALRLTELGAGRAFRNTILVIGAVSTSGTVLMTACPFSLAPTIHKAGIGLYFLGIVALQTVIGVREWQLGTVPRVLPMVSFVVVAVFLVFAALVMLYEAGSVSRSTPVIWEWLCALLSIFWVIAHSFALGREMTMTTVEVTTSYEILRGSADT